MEKLINEKNIQRDKNSGNFVTILVVIVAILSISRVVLANWKVESSETLREMDKKITVLSQVNKALAEDLREKESLTKISKLADSLGYVSLSKISFVSPQTRVAVNFQSIIQDR